mmetsp:Transcript_100416/g.199278  ORF Transcript_100416/g.199278 Transcript_100416/m.199278 type:complete len:202 (+) Transcript_100416:2579-3184(+)
MQSVGLGGRCFADAFAAPNMCLLRLAQTIAQQAQKSSARVSATLCPGNMGKRVQASWNLVQMTPEDASDSVTRVSSSIRIHWARAARIGHRCAGFRYANESLLVTMLPMAAQMARWLLANPNADRFVRSLAAVSMYLSWSTMPRTPGVVSNSLSTVTCTFTMFTPTVLAVLAALNSASGLMIQTLLLGTQVLLAAQRVQHH